MLHVALVWHMHQPDYRDPLTGRLILPWVRLHAVKDYLDLVTLGAEFPTIHQTFNLVPSLLDQLDAYVSDQAVDRHMELARIEPGLWTVAERSEIVERFFDLSLQRMLDPFPRLQELAAKRQRLRDEGLGWEAIGARFTDGELVDLTVLYHLAWTDPRWRASDPVLAGLSGRGRDYGAADREKLLAKHHDLMAATVPAYRQAAAEGRIELTVTPYAHPILPLLIDSDSARIGLPDAPLPSPAFRFPADATVQLQMAVDSHERRFGVRPRGIWASEQSLSPATMTALADVGALWTISDEAVLGRSLGCEWPRDAQGVPFDATALYRPYRWQDGPAIVFRDHTLSDLIGFTYSTWGVLAAARDLYARLKAIEAKVDTGDGVPALVTIALDGENCWEFYPEDGEPFLRAFYALVAADPSLRFVTAEEHLAADPEVVPLPALHSGSWIDGTFGTWIGEPTKNRAWDELRAARQAAADAPQVSESIWEHVRVAEGSDWFWWYGEGHSSANDAQFDMLFRHRLQAIYLGLGLSVPERLQHSLYDDPAVPEDLQRRGWLWAASQDLGGSRGTMHSADRFAGRLTWGGDGEGPAGAWLLRWQPSRGFQPEPGDQLVVAFLMAGRGSALEIPDLGLAAHGRLVVSLPSGECVWFSAGDSGWVSTSLTGVTSGGGWEWRLPDLAPGEFSVSVRLLRQNKPVGSPTDPVVIRWHIPEPAIASV
ncbi:MAG: glycoside hydrolase [Candidatus Sericytochromatia bacterium]|nr:glycoside hydrolase [Candidatus Sericytochromatia bacterium]